MALSAAPAIINADNPMGLTSDQYISITGAVVESKHLYPWDVFQQVQAGFIGAPMLTGALCLMLTNTAFESVKHRNDHSPEFEFFRHLRNASSHGNRFSFAPSEPRRPAHWRGIGFDHTLKGSDNPLQGSVCFGPLFGPADLIDLLHDIEVKLPNASTA